MVLYYLKIVPFSTPLLYTANASISFFRNGAGNVSN